MAYSDTLIIGTCSLCRGDVVIPKIWCGGPAPVPRCRDCLSIKDDTLRFKPIIPMKPIKAIEGVPQWPDSWLPPLLGANERSQPRPDRDEIGLTPPLGGADEDEPEAPVRRPGVIPPLDPDDSLPTTEGSFPSTPGASAARSSGFEGLSVPPA